MPQETVSTEVATTLTAPAPTTTPRPPVAAPLAGGSGSSSPSLTLAVWLLGHPAGADHRITDSQGTVRIDALVTTQVTVGRAGRLGVLARSSD